mgnify:FL=1
MAYKQNAGRGPMPKTGAGVPSALLQKPPKPRAYGLGEDIPASAYNEDEQMSGSRRAYQNQSSTGNLGDELNYQQKNVYSDRSKLEGSYRKNTAGAKSSLDSQELRSGGFRGSNSLPFVTSTATIRNPRTGANILDTAGRMDEKSGGQYLKDFAKKTKEGSKGTPLKPKGLVDMSTKTALMQRTDEKKGKPGFITKKNPNLSESERNLISDNRVNEKSWKGILKDRTPETFDARHLAAAKTQRNRDSTYIVNNRVTRKNSKSSTSSMAFVKPEDQENKIKGLSEPSKYRKNSFKRGKDGNVVVRGQFDNHYYSDY